MLSHGCDTKHHDFERKFLFALQTVPSDDHATMDLDVFRLQFCPGALSSSDLADDLFTDAYTGLNNSYVVRQLEAGKPYTFRVCGRADGASSWSPWSVPVVWATNLQRHGQCYDTVAYSWNCGCIHAFSMP